MDEEISTGLMNRKGDKMKPFLKLIAINILVTLGALLLLNLATISMYKVYKVYKVLQSLIVDPRARLPNYENIEWAAKYFQEFKKIPVEYQSYVGWRRSPYEGQTTHIDEHGIRNTPQHSLADPASPLVVFLGGSTIWGAGSDDSNTIPALFSAVAKGKYRSMNLGETAYDAFQGYLFLRLQTMKKGLRPDIVVSYDGVNEIYNLLRGSRVFSHYRENEIRSIIKIRGGNIPELTYKHFFFKPLQTFISKSIRYINSYLYKNRYDLKEKRVEDVARKLLESWLLTKGLAEEHGADFIAVLQPNAGLGRPVTNHLKLDADSLEAYRSLYAGILRLLQSPAYRELSNKVLVLTDAFDRDEYIYIDPAHVSPNGNRIIAEKIYNHLVHSKGEEKR